MANLNNDKKANEAKKDSGVDAGTTVFPHESVGSSALYKTLVDSLQNLTEIETLALHTMA